MEKYGKMAILSRAAMAGLGKHRSGDYTDGLGSVGIIFI